jgi:hypothetical protein
MERVWYLIFSNALYFVTSNFTSLHMYHFPLLRVCVSAHQTLSYHVGAVADREVCASTELRNYRVL